MGTQGREEDARGEKNVAIIFGVTGLVGKELARVLTSKPFWKVYGVARKSDHKIASSNNGNSSDYHFVSCDLLNPLETFEKLSPLHDVTHVFWVTWATQFSFDEEACCVQNKFMMANALDAILPAAKSLKHVSLQTGLKHYIQLQGPFGDDTDHKKITFFDEESPRVVSGINFYYVLEDLLKEKLLGASKVTWSVHRPGLIFGSSRRTLFNFMGGLCVYATICKHLKLPFVFGGSKECWEEVYIDGSDARLVANQHIWAATSDKISPPSSTEVHQGEAFNSINGTSFKWKEIWPTVGLKFGVEVPENMFSEEFTFTKAMADKGEVWKEIVEKEGLAKTEMEELANWGFLDVLFRFPFKLLGSRNKVNQLGFDVKYQTLDSILYWTDCMRSEKLIP